MIRRKKPANGGTCKTDNDLDANVPMSQALPFQSVGSAAKIDVENPTMHNVRHARASRFEEYLERALLQLESEGWSAHGGHPMGCCLIAQMFDLFFGVLTPSGKGTAKLLAYIQETPQGDNASDGECLVSVDSLVQYIALYYTFIGVFAAEQASRANPGDISILSSSPGEVFWITSRVAYCLLSTHCLCGLVFALHLTIMHVSQNLRQRRAYVVNNARICSLCYSAGPLTFVSIGVALAAEQISLLFRETVTHGEIIAKTAIITINMLLWLVAASTSTILVRDAMRPWPQAMRLVEKQFAMQSRASDFVHVAHDAAEIVKSRPENEALKVDSSEQPVTLPRGSNDLFDDPRSSSKDLQSYPEGKALKADPLEQLPGVVE